MGVQMNWFMPEHPEMHEWITVFDYVFQRGRVGSSNGITFVIHTAENGHNTPHLHARHQQQEVVLAIPLGNVITGNLSPKKLKIASQWLVDNAAFLKEKWNELAGGVCCFG